MPNFDNLPKGELDKFELYRQEKGFNFRFFCPSCLRNFESLHKEENCIHCGSRNIRELWCSEKIRDHPLLDKKFRYYCSKCEKNFESNVKFTECQMCGSRILNVYRWSELSLKDRILFRIFKTLDYPKIRKKGKSFAFTMPSLAMPALPVVKLRVFKREEEMPTY